MKYEIPKSSKEDILDDSEVKKTLDIIEKLIDNKLCLNIKTEDQLYTLLKQPEVYIEDMKIVGEIRNLRELIIMMSDIYYPSN